MSRIWPLAFAAFLIVATGHYAGAQPLAINPSAAASDIRNPSSTNPAAAASDIRSPGAINSIRCRVSNSSAERPRP